MRVLLQRVSGASVTAEGRETGRIGVGLVVLVGIGAGDAAADVDRMAEKVATLRVFSDEAGKFNLSLLDVAGGALIVSQFTLYADARKGRRPSFTGAARPDVASPLVERFAQRLAALGVREIGRGVFGAHMEVEIHNDGPVTIWLDSAELTPAGPGLKELAAEQKRLKSVRSRPLPRGTMAARKMVWLGKNELLPMRQPLPPHAVPPPAGQEAGTLA